MTDAGSLGEISKLKSRVNTRANWRPHPKPLDNPFRNPIAFRSIDVGSAPTIDSSLTGYVQGSVIYRRCYNLGGGQFAMADRHYLVNQARAEVYVQPFTVNQTTGAITVGTGAAICTVTNANGTNIDTGTFNQFGPYIMTQHSSPGLGTNSFSACTVSNNAVTASATSTTQGAQAQPQNNFEAPGSFNQANNTAYHYAQTYDTATGVFRRMTYSWNGNAIAVAQSEAPAAGSNQAYSNIWPVRHQFGAANQSPSAGAGLRVWRDSNGCPNYDLLNLSGGYDVTGNFQALGYSQGALVWDGFGLQLSNGRQIFYCISGEQFVRNGNTLTKIASQDFPVKWRSWSIGDLWPVAQDTWITSTTSLYEFVKFYVNPTTYRITILEVYFVDSFIQDWNSQINLNNLHISLTGNTNQFLVLSSSNYDNSCKNNVWVLPNPFTA
jgi:hypothetical protein